jgi:hypothetical protein
MNYELQIMLVVLPYAGALPTYAETAGRAQAKYCLTSTLTYYYLVILGDHS